MQRPWQIWLVFAACLVAVLAAVGWLSSRAIMADRSDAVARRQAVLEENARLALWRMDSLMAPIVAQETARPYFVYRPFLPTEPTGKRPANMAQGAPNSAPGESLPSPLLVQPSPFVTLYFQIDGDGNLSSPQGPLEDDARAIVPTLLSAKQLDDNRMRLDRLNSRLDLAGLRTALGPLEPAIPDAQWVRHAATAVGTIDRLQPAAALEANAQLAGDLGDGDARQIAQLPTQSTNPLASPSNRAQQQVNASPSQLARGEAEYQSRAKMFEPGNTSNYNSIANQSYANLIAAPPAEVRMSMMKPVWLDGQLLLARRVETGGKELIQGAVLDWPMLQSTLLAEVADLLPEAKLLPATGAADSAVVRRLASLPLELDAGPMPMLESGALSPVQMSLLVAWGAIGLAALAAAVLLRGVLALSERRAAFVSAVSHELRTPLTTFRMYAEMLSEGMVPQESDRRRYLDTLRREAERLTHLVANVLAYARLERGSLGSRTQVLALRELLEVATQRLSDRAGQCDLQLLVEVDDHLLNRRIKADPSAVEQILFNLVDNACKYAAASADRRLILSANTESQSAKAICLRLQDHGPGISGDERKRIFQPFRKSADDAAHSAPGVGLGLALSRRLARDMSGDLQYQPNASGACFVLTLPAAD